MLGAETWTVYTRISALQKCITGMKIEPWRCGVCVIVCVCVCLTVLVYLEYYPLSAPSKMTFNQF
jgi:hypothetical protein